MLCIFLFTVSPDDYIAQVIELEFNVGSARVCYNISIIDDSICEGTSENFISQLSLVSGNSIMFGLGIAEIIIEDEMEPECGKLLLLWCTSYKEYILCCH